MNAVLHGLAANRALPSTLVDRLIAVADPCMAADLAQRDGLSRQQALALAARDEYSVAGLVERGLLTPDDVDPAAQPAAALGLLSEGAGKPEWARMLAADPLTDHREKLAACPNLPPDVIELLAADIRPTVVAELALWTTAAMAARLAKHPHAEVRAAVAANEATPPLILASLVTGEGLPPALSCLVCDNEPPPFTHDPHCPRPDCDLRPGASCTRSHESTIHEMHERALRNPSTPPGVLTRFADHPSLPLRVALAARTDQPADTYERLADSPEPWVRSTLAGNPAIPEHLIRAFTTDTGHDVRRSLIRNPAIPFDVLTSMAGTVKTPETVLLRIENATSSEIGALAASASGAIRTLIAHHRQLPTAVRDALADDPDPNVAKAIASYPGLSDAQLRKMADRHGVRVIAKIAKNPGASPALLDQLCRHPPARKALREIARHPHAPASALTACLADHQARPIAARHPALPPQHIIALLSDDDWQVAEAAASNPSLPPAVMPKLVPPPGRIASSPECSS